MEQFIEVTEGVTKLINLSSVLYVEKGQYDNAILHMKYTPDIHCKETYEEIERRIKNASIITTCEWRTN